MNQIRLLYGEQNWIGNYGTNMILSFIWYRVKELTREKMMFHRLQGAPHPLKRLVE